MKSIENLFSYSIVLQKLYDRFMNENGKEYREFFEMIEKFSEVSLTSEPPHTELHTILDNFIKTNTVRHYNSFDDVEEYGWAETFRGGRWNIEQMEIQE